MKIFMINGNPSMMGRGGNGMRTCDTCINHNVSKQRECNTMNSTPADLFCWSDKKMQLEREHACLAYSIKMGATDAVDKCIARINSLKRRAEIE